MNGRTRPTRSTVALIGVTVALVAAAAVPATATADQSETDRSPADAPTVEVESVTGDAGETVTVPITLDEAPNGVVGYSLELHVADESVAEIRDAKYPDAFGLPYPVNITEGGSSVLLAGVDVDEEIGAGTTDLTLATVELELLEDGETALHVDSEEVETDNGTAVETRTTSGTMTIGSAASTDGGTDFGGSDDWSGSVGSTLVVGVVGVVAICAMLVGATVGRRTDTGDE